MKNRFLLSLILCSIAAAFIFTSCEKDESGPTDEYIDARILSSQAWRVSSITDQNGNQLIPFIYSDVLLAFTDWDGDQGDFRFDYREFGVPGFIRQGQFEINEEATQIQFQASQDVLAFERNFSANYTIDKVNDELNMTITSGGNTYSLLFVRNTPNNNPCMPDNDPPQIANCPSDMTIDQDICGATTFSIVHPDGADNCSATTASLEVRFLGGATDLNGNTVVTGATYLANTSFDYYVVGGGTVEHEFTFTDADGNSSTCLVTTVVNEPDPTDLLLNNTFTSNEIEYFNCLDPGDNGFVDCNSTPGDDECLTWTFGTNDVTISDPSGTSDVFSLTLLSPIDFEICSGSDCEVFRIVGANIGIGGPGGPITDCRIQIEASLSGLDCEYEASLSQQ